MTGSMSSSPGYICLCIVIHQQRLQVYTQSQGITKRTIGLREREERARCRLFYTMQQISTLLSSSKSCWQAIIKGDRQHNVCTCQIKNILNNWKSLQSLQRRKPRRHLCNVMNSMKNNRINLTTKLIVTLKTFSFS